MNLNPMQVAGATPRASAIARIDFNAWPADRRAQHSKRCASILLREFGMVTDADGHTTVRIQSLKQPTTFEDCLVILEQVAQRVARQMKSEYGL